MSLLPLDIAVANDDEFFDDGADPDAPLLAFSDEEWDAEIERVLPAAEQPRKAA